METFTRRDFLKLTALGMGSLAFKPFFGAGSDIDMGDIARVAIRSVSIYSQPNDKSQILYQRNRDELINIYEEVISKDGPGYNPLWYKVWRGYVHSAYLERVKIRLNPVADSIPTPRGQLAEVTVPMTQTMRYNTLIKGSWEPLYRLYYGSNHWVKGIDQGPDGTPWYRLHDELNELEYHAPAIHFRMVQPEEFAPISPEIDPWKKRIEVSISQQKLKAFEGDTVVLETNVSTGVPDRRHEPGIVKTDTPSGEYHVYSKMPSKHMGDGQVTASLEAYELPGVPWTTFFAPHGVAFHGTYWHTNFGMTMSHGCVNMRTEEAKWIFRWTTPVTAPDTWEQTGYGTVVTVK
ncbi:MAG TPA: L,D-transpeptidase family protein [Anaerolineaceae bacterium]